VGASDKTAKEVQMFGLAPWLTERYRDLSQRFYEENRNLSIRRGVVSALLSILGTVGYYAAYVVILIRAVKGDITIGTLTFLAASFGRGRDVIQNILLSASNVAEQARKPQRPLRVPRHAPDDRVAAKCQTGAANQWDSCLRTLVSHPDSSGGDSEREFCAEARVSASLSSGEYAARLQLESFSRGYTIPLKAVSRSTVSISRNTISSA
jgi:hypothetical protein